MKQQSSIYQKIAYFDKKYQILPQLIIYFLISIILAYGFYDIANKERKFQPGKVFFEQQTDTFVMKYSRRPSIRYISFYKGENLIWSQNCYDSHLEHNLCRLKDSVDVTLDYIKITPKSDSTVSRYVILAGKYYENGKEKIVPIDSERAKEFFYDDGYDQVWAKFGIFVCIFLVLTLILLIFCRFKIGMKNNG